MLDRIVNCNDDLLKKNQELNLLLEKRREEALLWMKKYEDLEMSNKKLEQKREEAGQEERLEISDSKAQEKLNTEELVFLREQLKQSER